MTRINKNSVSLAGEFAVLSQLALRGYDANMTLGHTKGVDILVSDPNKGRMLKLEVKTNYQSSGIAVRTSKLFGKFVSKWVLGKKNEEIRDPNLFYCFVNISENTKLFRFFIVPSGVVANYVKKTHRLWLDTDGLHKDSTMRVFRIGLEQENYLVPTPTAEQYEDKWELRG